MKTKLFNGYFVKNGSRDREFIDIDQEINEFLVRNKIIQIIDIKFSSIMGEGKIWSQALLIYK